jgi:enterochelin esterase-like enzyme
MNKAVAKWGEPSRRPVRKCSWVLICGVIYLSLYISGCASGPQIIGTAPGLTPTRTPIKLPTAEPATSTPFPTAPVTGTPACEQVNGDLEATSYPGKVVAQEVRVLVYLPPCYSISTQAYPVLYLLHGYPLDETHWLDLGIIETVEGGYVEGSWPRFLIVLPQIPSGLNVNSDGGDGSYEQEFIEGLVPFIEAKYRIKQGAENTALAGVSRGGVWSLEIGLHNAPRFGTVAALSPALHVNNPRPAYDPFSLLIEPLNRPERLFLSAGTDEEGFHEKTLEFVELLESLGIPHMYLETPGAHVNSTWAAIMGDLIEFVTAVW